MSQVRVGIDVGGTFTDLVASVDGHLEVIKVPTTRDASQAFRDALTRLSARGHDPSELLHGTTVATNAVLERRGGRLGFLGTSGFRHLLQLGRQDRPSLYDLRARRPEPLPDAALCRGITERVGPDGSEWVPLDEGGLRRELRGLRDQVDSIAVVFLHSYANGEHERRAARIVAEELPGVHVSVSCDVLPEFREYERASTTALDAYVQPNVSGYLERLKASLGGVPVGVMRSGGGLRGADDAASRPVHLLLSGPAAGVLGAVWAARRAGFTELVTLDLGGTSADVALVEASTPLVAEESSLDGLPFRTPCVDVVSVGAGGGSIAWVDDGGALRVGPRSAGADPGPAAYGRGGSEPTVTDAHVVIGRLGRGGLAGGELPLHPQAALEAVERLAVRLDLDVPAAARGVLRVVEATMTRAIRSVSVERGKDVRDFVLVAFGGAGPLHAADVARELGIGTVVVPPSPGALAALGLLVARRRADVSRTHPTPITPERQGELAALLSRLGDQASEELDREGIGRAVCETSYAVDCRYSGQSHELRVDVALPLDVERLKRSFHGAHGARYGFSREGTTVEAITLRATALGPEVNVPLDAPHRRDTPPPAGTRVVEGADVEVWQRDALPPGWQLRGPAVIEELDATTWLDASCAAVVDATGALVVEVA